jgi:hypothetical protein
MSRTQADDRSLEGLLTADEVHAVMKHLEREEHFFARMGAAVQDAARESMRGAGVPEWTEVFARLIREAEVMGAERVRLKKMLRRHCGNGALRLASLNVPGEEKAVFEERRRKARTTAARAAGLLRGLMASLAAWNSLSGSALDALLGISAEDVTYSATGTRAVRPRPLILESRS